MTTRQRSDGEINNKTWERWLSARLEQWRQLAIHAGSNRRDQTIDEAREVLSGHREVARELSLARRAAPRSLVHRSLEGLYASLHRAIYRAPVRYVDETISLFRDRVPAAALNLRNEIIIVTSLFLLSGLGGALLIGHFPDAAGLFLSPQMIETVHNGQLWTDDILNVVPSSMLSFELMSNNISVALTCLVLGVIYGLGTLYIICLNGLMLGGVFAYVHKYELADDLFDFVIAHGLVELFVICLAGAAGLAIGRAIARPGRDGRIQSVRVAMRDAGALAALSVPFLIGSGIIEGYVSPDPSFSTAARVTVGLIWFACLLAVLDGRWWRRAVTR